MVACQGGVWLLNDPFLAQRRHCPFVASVAHQQKGGLRQIQ